MSRLFLTFCLVACSTVAFGQNKPGVGAVETEQVRSEKRMALVIGNSNYASARLANPVNDAKDMAAALTRCGFTVTSVTDADKRAMRQSIRTFIEGLDRGSVALFYFAGHAVQSRGENYMIPVGADVKLEDEIPDECVSLTSVLGSLEIARTGMNLIILDACRDNPFRGFKRSLERGLKVLEAPENSESLIAYATAPGAVAADGTGRNGIYTACLLKYLTTPNLPVETVFKQVRKDVKEQTGGRQVPWVSLSMEREFFFVGKPSIAVAPAVTPAPPVIPVVTPPAEATHKTNKTMTVDLGGGVKMEMVWVPAGEFMMGSPGSEANRENDETQHRVTLSKGFWMGKYEVTQEQWERVMRSNPSKFNGARNPVEQVSWNDCVEFIGKLNQRVTGGGFRLPTEVEWEYACRAGTTTPFHYGGTLDATMANFDGNYPYGNGSKGQYRQQTTEVGAFRPNAFGLYDMHGNVWEWCHDWYGEYPTTAVTDPAGSGSGGYRVDRGGCWNGYAMLCRSADRGRYDPGLRWDSLGIRLARDGELFDKKELKRTADSAGVGETGKAMTIDLGGGVKMEFVWIEALKGWVGKYEVTNDEYRRYKKDHDSGKYEGRSLNEDRQPVVNFSYDDAAAFAEWASRQAKGLPAGYNVRLPDGKEWMTLAQCGDGRTYPWGNDWPPKCGNYADSAAKSAFSSWSVIDGYSDGNAVSCAVEQSGKNDWGLYGVGGNVWEWTSEQDGPVRVLRGTSWFMILAQEYLRCEFRLRLTPTPRSFDVGFRLVMLR